MGCQTIFMFIAICDDSIVGGKDESLLKRVYLGNIPRANRIFWNPTYIHVCLRQVQQVHVYIRDKTGKPASFLSGPVTCELNLKQIGE